MLPLLKELISRNPFVEEVDFQEKSIYTIDTHTVELLGRFTELKKVNPFFKIWLQIDLSDNEIRKLPNDLSPLHQITDLNISGNPIEDLAAVVESLQTMPRLENLQINLHLEEEVDYLLRQLPELKFLNGIVVERDAIFSEIASAEESQSARNQFEQTTTPNENTLYANIQQSINEERSYSAREATINIDKIKRLSESCPEEDFQSIKATETIKVVEKTNENFVSARIEQNLLLPKQIQDMIPSLIQEVKPQLVVAKKSFCEKAQQTSSPQLQVTIWQHIKNQTQQQGTDLTLLQALTSQPQSALTQLKDLVGQVEQTVQNALYKVPEDFANLIGALVAHQNGLILYQQNQIEKLVQKDAERNMDMQQLQAELKDVIEAAETFQKDSIAHEQEVQSLKEALRQAHQQPLQAIQNFSRGLEAQNLKQQMMQSIGSENNNPQNNLLQVDSQDLNGSSMSIAKITGAKQVSAGIGSKILPPRQLKDIINEIYSSKQKFDQKAREMGQPVETMEQFMYTYLVQKYGLKNLIVEWATAIINSIKFYIANNLPANDSVEQTQQDATVALFAKILKNHIDEGFHLVQQKIIQSIKQYTKEALREKWPLKSESDLSRHLSNLINQKCRVDDHIWMRLLQRLYPQGNVEVSSRLEALLNLRRQNLSQEYTKSHTQRRLTREQMLNFQKMIKDEARLYYDEIQGIILDFHIKAYEQFLTKINQIFNECDSDKDGVLNEQEFRQLLHTIQEDAKVFIPADFETEVERLLEVIDPHCNQRITYTEVIQLLENETVPVEGDYLDRRVSVLQKVNDSHFGLLNSGINHNFIQSDGQISPRENEYQAQM